ncbi:hypothetical protein SteCoe_21905 [Stentor coeruleus]|uniref:Uncharacterized protein n=1 Tax=Stentor coeruleus TaxID=5963 RepID=A0A1R2BNP4_9CILI|nr:hypothetical protein SteCoe_21905 [Stentor coeruleus]
MYLPFLASSNSPQRFSKDKTQKIIDFSRSKSKGQNDYKKLNFFFLNLKGRKKQSPTHQRNQEKSPFKIVDEYFKTKLKSFEINQDSGLKFRLLKPKVVSLASIISDSPIKTNKSFNNFSLTQGQCLEDFNNDWKLKKKLEASQCVGKLKSS